MDELLAFLTSVSGSGLRLATPLAVAALGECLVQRAGLINIGLEGIMLTGAFAGFIAGYWLGSPLAGVATAAMAGILMASVFAVASIRFRADQIVVGTALNIFALGLTTTAYQAFFGKTGSDVRSTGFTELPLGWLSEIPFLGPVLFSHNLFVYAVLPLTVLIGFWMKRTRQGIELVALGENPRAADTAGLRVNRQRFGYVLAGGALGGIAGSYLTLAHSNTFVENMTVGRGFIAIAIVILGKWRPWGILAGAACQ